MKGFLTINPLNELFRDAVNYLSYLLGKISQKYDSRKISKITKQLQVQIKSNMFEASDPISIFSFLHQFNAECDSNYMNKWGVMCLVPHFMNKPASKVLTTRFLLIKSGCRDHGGTLTSYCAVFNHLLADYASDEIIAETVSEIETMKKQPNRSATKYYRALWDKILHFNKVHDESRL